MPETATATGVYVDHALANHGTAAHAAEETGHAIGHALTNALLVAATAGFGDLVNQAERQQ